MANLKTASVVQPSARRPLSARQTRFVEEYLVDLSATQAAIRAGYSARTAASIGNEIMRKPEIKAAISEAQEARSLRTGITADRVLQKLADVAFGKISKVMSWGSEGLVVRPSAALSDADTAMISEVTQARDGTLRVKFHSKLAALEMLARHVGLYKQPEPEVPAAPHSRFLNTTAQHRAEVEEMLRECFDKHEAEHAQPAIGQAARAAVEMDQEAPLLPWWSHDDEEPTRR